MMRRGLLALLPVAAHAAEAPSLAPPPGAALPLDLPVRDGGRATTLGEAMGGMPAVFAFADYGCTTLCGTAIGLAAAMLPGMGLVPSRDYRLVVLGLDLADGPKEAEAMRRAWLGEAGALARSARFLTAAPAAIEAATAALGYQAVRRGDDFDHPLARSCVAPAHQNRNSARKSVPAVQPSSTSRRRNSGRSPRFAAEPRR
jgi:protein SCO1/2